MKGEQVIIWKDVVVVYFKVLLHNLLQQTKGTTKNLSKVSQ